MTADVQHIFGAGAIRTDGPYGPVPRAAAGPVSPAGGDELPPADIDRPGR